MPSVLDQEISGWVVAISLIAIVFVSSGVTIHRKAVSRFNIAKNTSFKLWGVSLVLLISFGIIFMAVSDVDAIPGGQEAKSMIYTSTANQLESEVTSA